MGSPSGEVLGGRVPESAFSIERLCKRVPFRESTRGESVPESAFSTERFIDGVPFRGRTRGESVRGGSKCSA